MPKNKQTETASYTALNSELERILADLQHDDLDVDLAMQYYERGLELIKLLEKHLAVAENKVTKLVAQPPRTGMGND